jgi:hypothetical protein
MSSSCCCFPRAERNSRNSLSSYRERGPTNKLPVLQPAALAFVSYGFVLVRVFVRRLKTQCRYRQLAPSSKKPMPRRRQHHPSRRHQSKHPPGCLRFPQAPLSSIRPHRFNEASETIPLVLISCLNASCVQRTWDRLVFFLTSTASKSEQPRNIHYFHVFTESDMAVCHHWIIGELGL